MPVAGVPLSSEAIIAELGFQPADDALVVHVDGDEEIHGEKSFVAEDNQDFLVPIQIYANPTPATALLPNQYSPAQVFEGAAWDSGVSNPKVAAILLTTDSGNQSFFSLRFGDAVNNLSELFYFSDVGEFFAPTISTDTLNITSVNLGNGVSLEKSGDEGVTIITAESSETWLRLGGASDEFVGLRGVGGELQIKLADGSAYAPMRAESFIISDPSNVVQGEFKADVNLSLTSLSDVVVVFAYNTQLKTLSLAANALVIDNLNNTATFNVEPVFTTSVTFGQSVVFEDFVTLPGETPVFLGASTIQENAGGDLVFASGSGNIVIGTVTTGVWHGTAIADTYIASAATWNAKENAANKDQVNGYAGLDSSGKLNPAQLPALAITDSFVVGSQAAMLALTAEVGDIAIRTDLNKTFILHAAGASTLGNWQELLTPTDTVTSVFGRSGAVTAQNNDYTWAQIDKTTSSLADIATRSASDLSSGTLPDARFPATLPAVSGVNLTGLTKSQVGLGSVENTALSTWAGSTNITTLGTIATGAIPETLITFTDVTTGNVSTTKHGFAPKGDGDTAKFLNANGAYSVPASSGANTALSNLAAVAINTALVTGAGVTATFTATAPAQITTAQAGAGVALNGSNAVAGSSTNGAGAGGGFTLTGGNGARLVSGDGDGGHLSFIGGTKIGNGTNGYVKINFTGAASAGLVTLQKLEVSSVPVAMLGVNLVLTGGGSYTRQDTSIGAVAVQLDARTGNANGGLGFINTTSGNTSTYMWVFDSHLAAHSLPSGGVYAFTSSSTAAGGMGGGTIDAALGRSTAGMLESNSGTPGVYRDFKARQYYVDQTITPAGTTGNQTINKTSGTVNIAAGGTTVTVTCSLCTVNSEVYPVIRTNDATAWIKNTVPKAGSFDINLGAAATGEISIGFWVVNQ